MNEQQFFQKREPDWKRLNLLTAKADVSPTQLSKDEIKEVFRLYRRVAGDLAYVRTNSRNQQLIQFLNDLNVRAYSVLYRRRSQNIGQSLRKSILLAAQTVRRRARYIWFSAVLTILSGVFGFIALDQFPATRAHLLPPEMEANFDHWRTGDFESKTLESGSMMTGFYMGNNPRVSIIAGSIAAATFGVGSAYMMFQNGALLGTLLHEVAPYGRVGYVLVSILPHGVPELSGIVIAGAAGFVMGAALINPGRKRRGQALLEAGKDAITLLITSVVLMFIAAPIEGFFSFNANVPDIARIAVIGAGILLSGLFWYGFGRHEPDVVFDA